MRAGTALGAVVAGIAMVVALSACVPTPATQVVATAAPEASIDSTPAASIVETATFLDVVDGDTIETSAGTVRIIGIDTPERGECGDAPASEAIADAVAAGDAVTLELPEGQNEQDRYGRLLRYVTTASGVDLGLLQLRAGNAVARYDSTDGYPAHPREPDYRAAQVATLGPDGGVIATGCQDAAPVDSSPGRAAG
ncbi:thermonuclease family protein [Microbacterium aoyamense]|uniref:Thermonuclease family protein n=1 Tax=Microbacterium aoyamense TaxID=344166 RepID=A0ABN2Q2D3_9MICO|nr:thermonuclease family protein [Microbacterium aoyamense]